MKNPANIAITGASSGLGAALARHYAGNDVTLHLQGRDAQRLEAVAGACRLQGATVHVSLLDVTDKAAMEQWLKAASAMAPMDLIIANAGISAGAGSGGESAEQVRTLFDTNIYGVINTVQPLLADMMARRHGQVAIISSLAGHRGLPSCPAYSASKACVRAYGEALRGWLGPQGVQVSVVCPGYIKTPMTDSNPFPMPFLMSAEKAATIISAGLSANRARIAFPLALHLPLWLLTCLPPALTDAFFSRLPAKPGIP